MWSEIWNETQRDGKERKKDPSVVWKGTREVYILDKKKKKKRWEVEVEMKNENKCRVLLLNSICICV